MFKNPATRKRNIIIVVSIVLVLVIAFFVWRSKRKKTAEPSILDRDPAKEFEEAIQSQAPTEKREKEFSVVPEEDRNPKKEAVKTPAPNSGGNPPNHNKSGNPNPNQGQGNNQPKRQPNPNGQGNPAGQKVSAPEKHPSLSMIESMEMEGLQ